MRRPKAPSSNSSNVRAQTRLGEIRTRIDELDSQIAAMLNERLKLAGELTEVKAQLGMAIKDRSREEQVLDRVSKIGETEQMRNAIRNTYERLFELSRQIQQENAIDPQVTTYFPQVTIFGIGLIGGALARLIKRRLPDTKIIGVDRDDVLADALEQGLIDKGVEDQKTALQRSSLIILAASPSQNIELLKEIAPLLSKRKLVIDVTSSKRQIVELAENLNLKGADFIGGHPLFGSERSGLKAALDLSVEGSTFCVVPGEKSSEISVRRLIRWLTTLSFHVEVVGSCEHDAVLARTSHLIQLVAVLIGSQIARDIPDNELAKFARLSGPGLRQFSRLMKSPPTMWREIVAQNKTDIVDALTDLQKGIDDLLSALKTDEVCLDTLFQTASRLPRVLDA
ncbi:MAG: prephenate dehydrogenase/arogenate dehydrogenase family protein [Candidatus Obscuribacterales bacterium]|nr:prephenate dehydrogenase/arogenate dehydrogenase family protein [Cyanobacteria bacterium SZAS LIN-5]RTL35565.1 MAG: prephenate dehydrogenase/arogenate dehydrogenase family protein [Candidatus Melainabacteria bacterium]